MSSHYSNTTPVIEVEHDEEVTCPVAVWVDCHFCFGDGCQECGWTGGGYVTEVEDEDPDQWIG